MRATEKTVFFSINFVELMTVGRKDTPGPVCRDPGRGSNLEGKDPDPTR